MLGFEDQREAAALDCRPVNARRGIAISEFQLLAGGRLHGSGSEIGPFRIPFEHGRLRGTVEPELER
jgi:hypothetical protein